MTIQGQQNEKDNLNPVKLSSFIVKNKDQMFNIFGGHLYPLHFLLHLSVPFCLAHSPVYSILYQPLIPYIIIPSSITSLLSSSYGLRSSLSPFFLAFTSFPYYRSFPLLSIIHCSSPPALPFPPLSLSLSPSGKRNTHIHPPYTVYWK